MTLLSSNQRHQRTLKRSLLSNPDFPPTLQLKASTTAVSETRFYPIISLRLRKQIEIINKSVGSYFPSQRATQWNFFQLKIKLFYTFYTSLLRINRHLNTSHVSVYRLFQPKQWGHISNVSQIYTVTFNSILLRTLLAAFSYAVFFFLKLYINTQTHQLKQSHFPFVCLLKCLALILCLIFTKHNIFKAISFLFFLFFF